MSSISTAWWYWFPLTGISPAIAEKRATTQDRIPRSKKRICAFGYKCETGALRSLLKSRLKTCFMTGVPMTG